MNSKIEEDILFEAENIAVNMKSQFVTLSHMLMAMIKLKYSPFINILESVFNLTGNEIDEIYDDVKTFIEETVPMGDIKGFSTRVNEISILRKKNQLVDGTILKYVLEHEEYLKESDFPHMELKTVSHGAIMSIPMGMSNKKEEEDWKTYVENLTETVKDMDIPIVERRDINERTIQILCRKTKNNPVHVGEPGVGKTAITKGLAKMIIDNRVPDVLKGSTLLSVDLGGMLGGATYRGEFEGRLKAVLEGCKEEFEKPILYIDEIHNIIGCGSSSQNNTMDAANILKPYLTEGTIKFIGATTVDEYNILAKDKAIERRFQKVAVEEPSVEESIDILKGIQPAFEKHHNIKYSKEAIESAVKLSKEYIRDRFLPDKAIDLIDEAGAYLSSKNVKGVVVEKENIEDILSKICKIPSENIKESDVDKLLKLEDRIKEKVYGQDEAIKAISDALIVSGAGLLGENKPIASFLFVGPTGVGKTEVVKQLAKAQGIKLLRYDMSEYMEETSIARFIGANAGYVGYEEGGRLVRDVRENPYSVVLLDEIEKSHPKIFNSLLQVMDDAVLTDGTGKTADFRNCIIIMTSNAGARDIGKNSIGFGAKTTGNEAVDVAVNKLFSPEFVNRITKIVKFNFMDEEMAKLVAEKELGILSATLEAKKIRLSYTDEAFSLLLKKGFSSKYGGREIQRVITNEIKPQMARLVLSKVSKIQIDAIEDNFVVKEKITRKRTVRTKTEECVVS